MGCREARDLPVVNASAENRMSASDPHLRFLWAAVVLRLTAI